jgi:RimJ/RimL family protein N-acetyltransferase
MDAWLPPTLKTERLTIRPFVAADFDAFRAYADGQPADEYGAWLGGASPEDAARYLVDTIARYGRPPRCDLGVVVDGYLVGGVAFHQVWMSPPTMELGWVLHPAVGGRGLTSEAVGALLGWLFEHFPDLQRVESRVRTTDVRAIRRLETFGFVREGVIRMPEGSGALMYGLLRAEWSR